MSERDDSYDDDALDPFVLVGSWANRTRVHRGRDEFTIDFIRNIPDPSRSVLVVRAIVAPIVGVELRDQLDAAWRGYHGWSMPKDADDE